MSKILICGVLMLFLAVPASALELEPPEAPESARELMPEHTDSFASGLGELLEKGVDKLVPELKRAVGTGTELICVVVLVSVMNALFPEKQRLTDLLSCIAIAWILLSGSNTMIRIAEDTVRQISDYGKLLCGVMTSALAAQGGMTAAAGLYTGTMLFDQVLSSITAGVLIPLIHIFLALSAANCALGGDLLKNLGKSVKNGISWLLKTVLILFTTYISITGVVSGTTDAAALKATKVTISSFVPVVGGILSDTSEAVLVSAGILKNAAGVYGILVFLALYLEPFLQIGCQYLVLKASELVCGVFGVRSAEGLIGDFTAAMGLLLAMTGTVCSLFLISTVCFMKGMGI